MERLVKNQKKILGKEREERLLRELADAEYFYIDGNNFCWDNSTNTKKRLGTSLVDKLLNEMNSDSFKARFPKAKIKLFFDGGICYEYRPELISRMNGGQVEICSDKADPVMLDEAECNGANTRSFILTDDHSQEYGDKTVVRLGQRGRQVSLLQLPLQRLRQGR